MNKLIAGLLMIVAVIHLFPLSGVIGAERLAALYGMRFDEPNLLILMRRRAVLFGLLGVFLLYAAFRPELRMIAIVAGLASTLSFIWLALSIGGYNALVSRVVMVDVAAVVCLVLAIGLSWASRRTSIA